MAITTEDAILAILKTWYAKEGVQNLLFRNSPVLKAIGKTRVEGKEQAFSSMYGFGGAVSADYTVALDNAANQAKNVEWKVTPGQLFSVYSLNAKEVQASLSRRGAYMKVAGNKHFAATEGMRKALAAAFYGQGYGELCILNSTDALSTTADTEYTFPEDAIIKITPGTRLAFKATLKGPEAGTCVVKKITGNIVTVRGDAAYTPAATDVVAYAGSVDNNSNPLLPVGLGGWLPIVGLRDTTAGSDWNNYIGQKFYDVNRDIAADQLAGAFYKAEAGEKKVLSVQKLLKKVRRQGSKADLIILNDDDWFDMSQEIESTNTYFTQTSTAGKKRASVGFNQLTAAFSTNFIENIVDDPYCPKGQFYVLDKDTVEMWSYTNTEYIPDGVEANEPGKIMNADEDNDKGKENAPYSLLIDDYISVQQGTPTRDGPTSIVATNLFATYAIWNTSVNGVGTFDGATNLVEAIA